MLTLLCSPKPFVGEAMWNQANALRSWRAIHPDVEIIIFGMPTGTQVVAAEVNAKVVSEFETSSTGAPSFNAMVAYANQYSQHDLIVYVNCDILLSATVLHAMQVARQRFAQFLLVGERLDLAQDVIVDVCQLNWTENLLKLAAENKLTVHGPTGADYFGFVRKMWTDLPPVFMGRAMCDQALLHNCLSQQIPVINATLAMLAIHQFHNYNHITGGMEAVFHGQDRNMMSQAHSLKHSLPTVADANWRFADDGQILQGNQPILRRAELNLRYRYRMNSTAMLLRAIQYVGGGKTLQPKKMDITRMLKAWQQIELTM